MKSKSTGDTENIERGETSTKRRDYLADLREGRPLTLRDQILMTVVLSMPAILSQLTTIVMNFIDASMVGALGANDSASVGLISTTTWLMHGVSASLGTGFTIQVAQAIGALNQRKARDLMRQGLAMCLMIGLAAGLIGALISGQLPVWLGGEEAIRANASRYFLIWALTLPIMVVDTVAGSMLQCSGNMVTPSVLNILRCSFNVVFNALFIFPTGAIRLGPIALPGLGLGVVGAALGTSVSHILICLFMLTSLLVRSPMLHLRRGEPLRFIPGDILRALRLALPIAFERMVMSGAQIASTVITAPLGAFSLAANSFAITIEGLCYMPGYGLQAATTTVIGQAIGAGRRDLVRRLAYLNTALGVGIMTVTGALMYVFAPALIGLISPVPEIRELGAAVLRIEAFAEPMYAASIVAAGAFNGAGDTLIPSVMNFASMWLVRITLAALLAPRFGLRGVWFAMAFELTVRGIIFLIRLRGRRWLKDAVVK